MYLNREIQPETGWLDLIHRGYDPTINRFLQVDPVVEGQEHLSPYQYGWNNPVLRSDPNGDCPDCDERDENRKGIEKSLGNYTQDLQKELVALPGKILSFTDVNDATVMATTFTRRGNAINLDGTQASTSDKIFAFGGAIVPGVGGSAIKRGGSAALEFIGERAVGAYKALQGKFNEAHHIIQDAAAKNIPGYSKRDAPTIHLDGSSKTKGTEHNLATETQNNRRSLGDGGNYGSERRVAYRSLRAAGLTKVEAKQAVRKADDYFQQLDLFPK